MGDEELTVDSRRRRTRSSVPAHASCMMGREMTEGETEKRQREREKRQREDNDRRDRGTGTRPAGESSAGFMRQERRRSCESRQPL